MIIYLSWRIFIYLWLLPVDWSLFIFCGCERCFSPTVRQPTEVEVRTCVWCYKWPLFHYPYYTTWTQYLSRIFCIIATEKYCFFSQGNTYPRDIRLTQLLWTPGKYADIRATGQVQIAAVQDLAELKNSIDVYQKSVRCVLKNSEWCTEKRYRNNTR